MPLYEDVKQMAAVLRSSLREKNVDISHGESLDLVARQFRLKNWNVLSARLKNSEHTEPNSKKVGLLSREVPRVTEFRDLFPEAKLPRPSIDAGVKSYHPFPRELFSINELAAWRHCWENDPISTPQRLFFPQCCRCPAS